MREAALRDFGVAARSLLDRAWRQQPADPWLVRLGLQAVSESLPAEPAASALILRRALTDEEIREHGFETLRVFAEQVPWLAQHDVDLVTDLYRAAFAFRDTSEEAVQMRTGVLA